MRGRDVYGPLSSRVAARRFRSFQPLFDIDEHVGDTGMSARSARRRAHACCESRLYTNFIEKTYKG